MLWSNFKFPDSAASKEAALFLQKIKKLDRDGNIVVKYIYDCWGNHAVIDANGQDIVNMQHIGNLNPIRYRSYYYDTETGLYYLQTRYYDPELGRFISQDSIEYADYESVNGLNLYAVSVCPCCFLSRFSLLSSLEIKSSVAHPR